MRNSSVACTTWLRAKYAVPRLLWIEAESGAILRAFLYWEMARR